MTCWAVPLAVTVGLGAAAIWGIWPDGTTDDEDQDDTW